MPMEQTMNEVHPSRAQLCPGCNRNVDPLRAPAVSVLNGKIVHFCSPSCRETFLNRGPKPVLKDASPDPSPSSLTELDLDARRSEEVFSPPPSESEPVEESPFPHLKLYPSTLILPQIILMGIWVAILPVIAFVPPYLEGRLPTAIAAAALLFAAAWAFIRERRLGFRRLLESSAVPISAFAVLGASFFDFSPRRAAFIAVLLPAAETAGNLLLLFFRHRSGVLRALADGDGGIIPFSWRDNSKPAEGARTLAAIMDWARFPVAAAVSIPVYLASKSEALTLIAFAAAIVSLNPRTIRMSIGDAHLRAALRAARIRAEIRDADTVYRAAVARTVLFIAKRTLVEKAVVLDWKVSEDVNPKTALDAFYTIESAASGRIAEAACAFAVEMGARAASNVEVTRVQGLGFAAETPWGPVLCGSRRLLLERGISTGLLEPHAADIEACGRRAVFLGLDETCAAVFAVEEPLVEGAEWTVREIRKMGVNTAMLTSAETQAAQALGDRLGFDAVLFETAEENVGEVLRNLQDSGDRVLLVGNGPAFEAHFRSADAAIALHPEGGETQAGFNANDNAVTVVPKLIRAAKQAHRSAMINLVSGIAVSIFGLGLAVAGPSGYTLLAMASLNFLVSAACAANAPFPALESILSIPLERIRMRLRRKL